MNVKRTTSLSTLYLLITVVGFTIFAVLLSVVLTVKIREVISNSEHHAVETSFATLKSHLSSYLEDRALQLADHATFPLLIQSVMLPEHNANVVKDFMGELRILGKPYQLVLTDFLGHTIQATRSTPFFNYAETPWVEAIMNGTLAHYIGFNHDGANYFWEIAVPVLFGHRPEGVLVTEIPIGPIHQFSRLTQELQHARLQIVIGDQVLATWGGLQDDSAQTVLTEAFHGLTLQYGVSHHAYTTATGEVLFPILLLCGGIALVLGLLGIVIGKRFLIRPIEQLKVESSSLLDEQTLKRLPTNQPIQELQELAAYFNVVQERAWNRKNEVLQINATLEARIQEATQEVSHQNQDLKVARDEALVAVRSKAMFLATMSHEIRTPMNGILGMTELLADTDLSLDQQELIRTLHSSGENLLAIINDILDFSKIESGKLTIEHIDFDLRASVEEVLASLGPQARAKGLELVGLVHAKTPTAVQGDPVRFRQILTNLVGNAIKFTATGEVFVQVTPYAISQSQVHFRVEVKDTGIGLSAEEQTRLFQAFTQANQSTTRKYGGTGLGLAICQQLVDLMQGEIGVESTPGAGSCFWFTVKFPLQSNPVSERLTEVSLSGLRILFVDDHATNRFILDHYAESWGMSSSSASSGAEGLILLESAAEEGQPFDLVVIDQKMPDMDGCELAQAIKASQSWHSLPLILLTSLGYQGEAHKAKQAHFSGYLTKPIRQQTLRRAVALVMGLEHDSPKKKEQSFITRHIVQEQEMAEKPRILLVEDNLVNQKVAVKMLTKLGYQVDVVNNGLEAVGGWQARPYALILMDCLMPEMDGFQATEKIREAEGVKRKAIPKNSSNPLPLTPHESFHIPILAMTANTMEGDREKCLEAGMDDFIPKPVNIEFLGSMLAKWLSGHQQKVSPSVVDASPSMVEKL